MYRNRILRRPRRGLTVALLSLLFALAVQWAACAATAGRPPHDATVRVMTLNIFAGNDLARQSSLTRVAALIDSLDIDVVFLQEVDRLTRRSGGIDQPAVLGELTGMHVRFGASMQFDGGEFGNAILSRLPIASQRIVRYERTDSTAEPRSLLHAVIAREGRALHLVSTHLDHRANSAERLAQLRQLADYLDRHVPVHEPLILGADLNAAPDAPGIRALLDRSADAWPLCGSGAGFTFRSDAPDRRIDYVLLARGSCTRAWVHDTRISDHRPLIVHITPGGAAGGLPR